MTNAPTRYCMGDPVTLTACGRVAVVVCSMVEELGGPPVQWFACELGEHQALDLGADVEPIAAWFLRLGPITGRCPGCGTKVPRPHDPACSPEDATKTKLPRRR